MVSKMCLISLFVATLDSELYKLHVMITSDTGIKVARDYRQRQQSLSSTCYGVTIRLKVTKLCLSACVYGGEGGLICNKQFISHTQQCVIELRPTIGSQQ